MASHYELSFGSYGRKSLSLKGTSKLLKDFENLFISSEDSDLTIKVKDTEFRVHKIILRARSPVFHSMFRHNMVEKNTGTVDIIDCEPEAFKIFLIYLYTGCVEYSFSDLVSMGMAFDLYRTADKYDAEELKIECSEFIGSNLCLDNILDVLDHGLQYSDQELLKSAINFFTKNFKLVIETVKWQSFMRRNRLAANQILLEAELMETSNRR